ncbi:toll/interleukin-1 receptor domain-containing protein [Leptospira alstonii]|uniref:TIR domain protein n=2 Tax=Leptospira alstonii TaxID=28452 RepID=M6D1V5_9LEPT|nr:toll/interleukin-1 receptor domain-containing protein [Leptospira alstonii]EMJ96681.1 TIR domain protein [Leptospira alstonii serovar Sichuan str. 79601]EQA78811.1 TIR domain protein [Leptospira alstonii serovar Pingchang str. 80-412]
MTTIFISHKSTDKPVARTLKQDLEKVGFKVWLDEDQIRVGDSISSKIQEGLQESDFLLILLSKAALESGWVQAEWKSKYLDEINLDQVVILPILLETCSIPILLKDKKYADFRNDYQSGLSDLKEALIFHNSTIQNISSIQSTDDDRIEWVDENKGFLVKFIENLITIHYKVKPENKWGKITYYLILISVPVYLIQLCNTNIFYNDLLLVQNGTLTYSNREFKVKNGSSDTEKLKFEDQHQIKWKVEIENIKTGERKVVEILLPLFEIRSSALKQETLDGDEKITAYELAPILNSKGSHKDYLRPVDAISSTSEKFNMILNKAKEKFKIQKGEEFKNWRFVE